MTPTHRKLHSVCRTLHIYLTLLALVMILFFSLSGFMLNHERWFISENPRRITTDAVLPQELVKRADKFEVVEYLRARQDARGEVTHFSSDDDEIRVTFSGPGRRSEITIQRADGNASIASEYQGAAALLADLHRGKGAGSAWKMILDATAILLFLGCVTGLIIFVALTKRRVLGVTALAAGALACVGVYIWMVP